MAGAIPVPLPADFVQGIDVQRLDFERGMPSYLRGQWAEHGWWYYYLYVMVVKMPLGTWGLALLAVAAAVWSLATRIHVDSARCVRWRPALPPAPLSAREGRYVPMARRNANSAAVRRAVCLGQQSDGIPSIPRHPACAAVFLRRRQPRRSCLHAKGASDGDTGGNSPCIYGGKQPVDLSVQLVVL